MVEFRTIEIDFDVHKVIEGERQSFAEMPNDALRRLLRLPPRSTEELTKKLASGERSWSGEGVTLRHGTMLRMRYNGRQHEGQILDGKWVISGKTFDSPSGAASGIAVTKRGKKTRLDGWMYWEAMAPGDTVWKPIRIMRPEHNAASKLTLEELGL